MKILAIFNESSVPKNGLNPVIKIYDLSTNEIVINNELMIGIGDGQYIYNFIGCNETIDYSVICDSQILTGSEKYAYAIISFKKYRFK